LSHDRRPEPDGTAGLPERQAFLLRDEIVDDYGFIGRPDDGGPNYPDDDDGDAGEAPIVA